MQDTLGTAEMATGVHDCGYGRITGMGMSMLWVWIRAYVRVCIDVNFL